MDTTQIVTQYGAVLDTINAMIRVAGRRIDDDRWEEAGEILDAAAFLMETLVKAVDYEAGERESRSWPSSPIV